MFVKDDDGVLKFVNLQSNKNVYVMIMAYAKDGKAPYRHFLKIGSNSSTKSRRKVSHIVMKIARPSSQFWRVSLRICQVSRRP